MTRDRQANAKSSSRYAEQFCVFIVVSMKPRRSDSATREIIMQDDKRTIHRTTTEARGGSTPHIVRWVLGISLLAAILALSAIWIFGATSQNEIEEEANVASREQGVDVESSTDSIVVPTRDEAGAPPASD